MEETRSGVIGDNSGDTKSGAIAVFRLTQERLTGHIFANTRAGNIAYIGKHKSGNNRGGLVSPPVDIC